MPQTNQKFPSVGGQDKRVLTNADSDTDGSVEVYFGPKASARDRATAMTSR
jgi:hypothetical protein